MSRDSQGTATISTEIASTAAATSSVFATAELNESTTSAVDSQPLRIFTTDLSISILSLTMVTALVGNLFMAFFIVRSSTRRLGPVQILMLHTCVADIAFALCCILPQIAIILTYPYFYGNDVLCKIVSVVQIVPMYASSYLLLAISLDRYIAICKPISAMHWKYKRVFILAASAWVASFLFSIPQAVIFRYGTPTYADQMQEQMVATERSFLQIETCFASFKPPWLEVAYTVWFSAAAWLIPSIIIGVLYTLVCCAVYQSSRVLHNTADSRMHLATCTTSAQPRNGYASQSPMPQRSSPTNYRLSEVKRQTANSINRQKIKTVKLTLTIVVCNFILWSPFCITNFLSAVISSNAVDQNVAGLIVLVGNLNSCVNPWIYLAFNHDQLSAPGRNRLQRCPSTTANAHSTATVGTPRYRAVPTASNVHSFVRRKSSGESLTSYTTDM